MATVKNKNVRGGGGICPVRGASFFNKLDVSQLAGLGKASAGQTRELLAIPEGYRLENTGIRIEFSSHKGVRADASMTFRGVVWATPPDKPGEKRRAVELPKRSEPSWSGLHLRLDDGETLAVQVQERSDGASSWRDSFKPVTMEPLKAFTVQDQDIVWFKTPARGGSSHDLVWAELSLQKKTEYITKQAKGANVASRHRKISATKFEPAMKDAEQVEQDRLMLQELLDTPDPMTKQDIVSMKDVWNKCLGWISMTGEHFTESLFLRCPDLLTIFGDIPAELAFDMFVSLIDMSVRNLDKRTEVIARESYRVMPLRPSADAPFATAAEGFTQFAQLGMRPRHWKEARVIFLICMKEVNPYIEKNDEDLLALGTESCVYRFWTHHIMKPAMQTISEMDKIFDSPENRTAVVQCFAPLAEKKTQAGMAFYKKLFNLHPEVIPYFGNTEMDFLAGHLFEAVEMLANAMNNFDKALPVLQHLGKIHDRAAVPCSVYSAIGDTLDLSFRELIPGYGDGSPEGERLVVLWSALLNRSVLVMTRISFVSERLLRKALEWVEQVAHELKWDDSQLSQRRREIENDVRMRGTYTHTEEEVVHGARVAWRNSAKCIGRIAWNTLLVRDKRHVKNLDAMFAECLEHQRLATADGSLKAVMTVFAPRQPGTRMGTRFWNLQLVRFACYENDDGTLMGDGANKAYTDECIAFGWQPPSPRSEFDVLPLVIEDPVAGVTKMFELPKEYHKVTMITHPKYPAFDALGLRWCVVPTVTSFTLRIGGLEYPCNPFNGWFMETEITRDLLEPGRMNKMEAIAKAIGVNPDDEEDFWRERVAIETNKAVMHSFRRDGHSIVDHVTAQAQFLAHDAREKREGRECPAQWSWVVPAFGGSTLPIWHHEMRDFYVEPQYDYQAEIYSVRKESTAKEEELLASEDNEYMLESLLIAYASVTGTAEGYAFQAKKLLRPLQVDCISCENLNPTEIWSQSVGGGGKYSAVLFITSTFGEGHPPPSAEKFFKKIESLPVSALAGTPYAVMAIGSTVYPDFCQAGIDLDKALLRAGGKQLIPLSKGDEVNRQEDSVLRWVSVIGSLFNLEQNKALIASGDMAEIEDRKPFVVTMLNADDERVIAAVSEEEKLVPNNHSAGTMARFLSRGYKLCKVIRNEELVDFSTAESRELFRSTRYLAFDLDGISKGESADLVYETGDHARIFPANDASTVQEMCDCLGVDAKQWIHVHVEDRPPLTVSTMRIEDLFSLELGLAMQEDANTHLIIRMLEIAREFGNTNDLQAELDSLEVLVERLGNSQKAKDVVIEEKEDDGEHFDTVGGIGGIGLHSRGHQATPSTREPKIIESKDAPEPNFAASVVEQHLTVPQLLKQYPSIASLLTLSDCIETLPRLKPRFYSIASSSEMHPTTLELSVGKLSITCKSSGLIRKGLCSHYLAGTVPNSTAGFVRLGLTQSAFRLPEDYRAPIIMVGPGTGLAPMLGFLQAREHAQANGKELGPCMVFFGCRAENDFLHSARMRKWAKDGVVSDLQVAFSRLPGRPKEYVQHRLAKHCMEVWKLLSQPNAHYYICGDSAMADDVFEALKVITKTSGGLDHYGCVQFFEKMKKERRFQADVWGVVEKRDEALKRLVNKRYNKGDAWLKQFDEEKKDDSEQSS